MLATEDKAYTKVAMEHLEFAIEEEAENAFAWHQLAIAYARDGQIGMADLATAERHYYTRQLGPAAQFAKRARDKLEKGSPNWQRATDILQVAVNATADERGRGRAN